MRGLDITVVLNGFNTRENDVVNVGGHVTWRVSPTVDLDAGIDYAFYKYILFQNTERENVYTYSVRVDWRARKKTTVTGGISIDDDRFFTYTTLFARVTVRF